MKLSDLQGVTLLPNPFLERGFTNDHKVRDDTTLPEGIPRGHPIVVVHRNWAVFRGEAGSGCNRHWRLWEEPTDGDIMMYALVNE